MDHVLVAGCLRVLFLAAALAFVAGLLVGVRVQRRDRRNRLSDAWRFAEWQRDPRTRHD